MTFLYLCLRHLSLGSHCVFSRCMPPNCLNPPRAYQVFLPLTHHMPLALCTTLPGLPASTLQPLSCALMAPLTSPQLPITSGITPSFLGWLLELLDPLPAVLLSLCPPPPHLPCGPVSWSPGHPSAAQSVEIGACPTSPFQGPTEFWALAPAELLRGVLAGLPTAGDRLCGSTCCRCRAHPAQEPAEAWGKSSASRPFSAVSRACQRSV